MNKHEFRYADVLAEQIQILVVTKKHVAIEENN